MRKSANSAIFEQSGKKKGEKNTLQLQNENEESNLIWLDQT